MRLALGIEYDGTDWLGWQTQPNRRTVQDQLELAISQFTERHHASHCAGRTDAGVHATGQVVHLDTEIDRPSWSWVRGLNAFLPDSIAVQWAAPVAPEFHARFSALSRHYVYRIWNHPVRSPTMHRQTTWFYRPLDTDRMQAAAESLLGEHDFSAFRSSECQANSPIRRLTRFEISREGPLITCRLSANAFLHPMVRNLIGSVVEIGRGAAPIEWAKELLVGRDRTLAARTFPASGLCLERVEYDSYLLCVPESKFAD